MMKRRYVTVDVFTKETFGGNPLAVVLDGEGIATERMQKIAREFSYPETTFVLPPQDPKHTAQVRIFTPAAELPFAGHPNVGTGYVLAALAEAEGRSLESPLLFEEKAGLVPIDLRKENGKTVATRLKAPQTMERLGDVAVDKVAAAVSLDPAAIETAQHTPCIASSGIPFVIAELHSKDALARARPNVAVFEKSFRPEQTIGILMYCHEDEPSSGVDIHSRMFAPLLGVPEDPATGSANVALIGLLAHLHRESDLKLEKTIAQGDFMGRPSRLHAEAEKKSGELVGSWIGGPSVALMRGVLFLDGNFGSTEEE